MNNFKIKSLQLQHPRKVIAMPSTTHVLFIEALIKFLHMRDIETAEHTRRVAQTVVKFAQNMNVFSKSELKDLYYNALLHDVGKIGIPDVILKKKGKLTKMEMEVIQKHPQYTYDLFFAISGFESLLEIAYCHHEKWDGTGYPRRLKGEKIPLNARLFAVVDVWDALTSDRCYRSAWSDQKAYKHILQQSGTHFDPIIVKAFVDNFHLFAHASETQPAELKQPLQVGASYAAQL